MALEPLDAVITGYAYESATTALGVIEEGRNTKGWISPEMLCTLDNFIKVLLFNNRIFVTGSVGLKDNHFIPRDAQYQAGEAGRRLLDQEQVFVPIAKIEGDSGTIQHRVAQTLDPVDIQQAPLFAISCKFPRNKLTILQEMVYLDVYFIEYAIEQFGAERFKPVFPGEHLYLGLRQQRVGVPQATHTIADIPGRRLRALVHERMERLNAPVSQGAPMLPSLSPMFVSRVLHDSANSSRVVSALLTIRNSATMTRFRRWMVRYWDLAQSADFAKRTKADQALNKLNKFSFAEDISTVEFGKTLLNFGKDVLKGDVVGIIEEIAPFVMKYLSGVPLSGLREFGKRNSDPRKLQQFLAENFGDKFNRNDLDSIAAFLELPEDLADWGGAETTFATIPGRVDPNAPPLGRPYSMLVGDAAHIRNAEQDFEELFSRAERVTPEMLR